MNSYVFPELVRLRDTDSIEARFEAFKIPESNFLVFEATVRTCRDVCQPAYCSSSSGKSEPSFGRRRRDVNNDTVAADEDKLAPITVIDGDSNNASTAIFNATDFGDDEPVYDEPIYDEEEHVREMIEVRWGGAPDASLSFQRISVGD